MTREQWARLKILFHGALAQPHETRQDWLARHSAGDEMLAREAAALIVAHETAERFLELPATVEPLDLAEALRTEMDGDPLGALERDIETSRHTRAAGAHVASPEALWRWQLHQLIVAIVYGVMIWPASIARMVVGGDAGNAVFVAVLVAAIGAMTLRLHLWFTSWFRPAELEWARMRAAGWVLAADGVLTTAFVVGGALVGNAQPVLAAVEITIGIAAAFAFAVIEPATSRAAFGARL